MSHNYAGILHVDSLECLVSNGRKITVFNYTRVNFAMNVKKAAL